MKLSLSSKPGSKCLVGLGILVLGPHVDPVLVPAGECDVTDAAGDVQHQVPTLDVFDHVLPFLRPRFELHSKFHTKTLEFFCYLVMVLVKSVSPKFCNES